MPRKDQLVAISNRHILYLLFRNVDFLVADDDMRAELGLEMF